MKLQISYLFLQDETFSLTQPPQSYVRDTGGPRYIPTAACTYVTLVHKKKKKKTIIILIPRICFKIIW